MQSEKKTILITSLIFLMLSWILIFFVFREDLTRQDVLAGIYRLRDHFTKKHPDITFKNVTEQAGIHFRHFQGVRTSQLPEDMGSGAAWIDYDRDGWQDLFLVNEAGPITMDKKQFDQSRAVCALYHNNKNGTFTNVTRQAGITFKGWGMGVAVGDYNNDGWPDIFIAAYGHNVLYRNNGDGTFTDVTKLSGLYKYKGFWTDGRWGDFDRDGYLDLYVTGYVKYKAFPENINSRREGYSIPINTSPYPFKPQSNLLFRNLGNGKFEEMAVRAGVSDPTGKSLSAGWCDINGDGWPDLLVANDVSPNKLYLNQHNMTFRDASFSSRFADLKNSMGIAVGDWDQDGDMDLFLTNWLNETNDFFINMKERYPDNFSVHLRQAAGYYGLGRPSLKDVGWGTSFIDFDNDSRLDLFVANGSTNEEPQDKTKLIPMSSQLFWNKDNYAGFYDITKYCGKALSKKRVSRGAAFGDYDNDGDVDVVIVNNGGPPTLLQNEGGNKKNWLEISLKGVTCNRSAIGTRLDLYAGGEKLIREVGAQASYQSQNSLVQHFGLGHDTRTDSLVIYWPDGRIQKFRGLPVNHIIDITESDPVYAIFK